MCGSHSDMNSTIFWGVTPRTVAIFGEEEKDVEVSRKYGPSHCSGG
jgi:hypothetical protein